MDHGNNFSSGKPIANPMFGFTPLLNAFLFPTPQDTTRISTGLATDQPHLRHMDNIPAPTATYIEASDNRVWHDDVEHTYPQEALGEKMPKGLQLAHLKSAGTVSCTMDESLKSFDRHLCAEEVKGETERETEEHATSVETRRDPAAEPNGNVVEGGQSSSFTEGSKDIRDAPSSVKIPAPRINIDRPTKKGLDEERSPTTVTGIQLPAPRPSFERPTRKTMDEAETLTCERFRQEIIETPAADVTHRQKSGGMATEKAEAATAHAPEWANVDVYSRVSAVGGVSESRQDENMAVEGLAVNMPLSGGVPTSVGIHSTVSVAGDASEITPTVDNKAYTEQDNAIVATHVPEGASANVGVRLTVSTVGDESEIAPAVDIACSQEEKVIAAENMQVTRHALRDTLIDDDVHPYVAAAVAEDTSGAVSATGEVQERIIAESKLDDIDEEQALLENPRKTDVSTSTTRTERGIKAFRRRRMRSHSARTEAHASDDAYARFSDDEEHVPVCSKVSCVIC